MSMLLRGAMSAVLLAASAPALAGPIQALKDYNLIVFSDTTLQSQVEGAVYVDGNYNAGSVQVASKGTNAQGASLVVTGNVTNNPKVKTGDAYVGGTSQRIDFQGGGGTRKALVDVPGGLLNHADFVRLSSDLFLLDAGISYDRYSPGDHMNGFVIAPGLPDENGVSVIALSADFFPNTGKIRFAAGADALDTIIINVAGATINFRGWQAAGVELADNIIWNFFEATEVSFLEQSWGTVLAPNARVQTNSQMSGSIVALSSAIGGQLRAPTYAGNFAFPEPVLPEPGPGTDIPEPAMLGLVAAGLGLLAWRRRAVKNGGAD